MAGTVQADNYTDSAGTGTPTFTYGAKGSSSQNAQFDNITNAAGSGAPTFTYGAKGAASQIAQFDSLTNVAGTGSPSFPFGLINLGVVAANDSAVVFTNANNRTQICTPTAARTYTMPTTSILAGDRWYFYNQSTTAANFITVNASDATAIDYVIPNGYLTLIALQNTPTTSTHWKVLDAQSQFVAFTPTYTAFGTVTGSSVFVKRIRDTLIMGGKFTTGTVTGSEARISLPFSASTSSAWAAGLNGLVTVGRPSSGASYFSTYYGFQPSVAYLNISKQDSATANLTVQVGTTVSNSEIQELSMLLIPISGWN